VAELANQGLDRCALPWEVICPERVCQLWRGEVLQRIHERVHVEFCSPVVHFDDQGMGVLLSTAHIVDCLKGYDNVVLVVLLDERDLLVVVPDEEVRTVVLTVPEIHIILEPAEPKCPGFNVVFELPQGSVVGLHVVDEWSLSEWILEGIRSWTACRR
jgi:hypothetical protein